MNQIKGFIFDLDGTLVDSMWVWKQIDIDFLSKLGHTVPPNLNEEITHLSFTQTAEYFKKRFKLKNTVENIMNCWNDMAYDYYSSKVRLKKGAFEYLTNLKSKGYKIALATSNSTLLLEATLKNNKIYDLFDAITITDEVKKSKENPDIYLLSAKKLGLDPNQCMVYEDIIPAAKGAKLAGMKVTAIYDEHAKDQADKLKEICDFYILDYTNLI